MNPFFRRLHLNFCHEHCNHQRHATVPLMWLTTGWGVVGRGYRREREEEKGKKRKNNTFINTNHDNIDCPYGRWLRSCSDACDLGFVRTTLLLVFCPQLALLRASFSFLVSKQRHSHDVGTRRAGGGILRQAFSPSTVQRWRHRRQNDLPSLLTVCPS